MSRPTSKTKSPGDTARPMETRVSEPLASADRLAEDVGIAAVVIAELEFRDVEGEICAAYLVIAAHDAVLHQAPETLMVAVAARVLVCGVLVRCEQAAFRTHNFLERNRRTHRGLSHPSFASPNW